uniref:Uncharacterized protein n=1 Tax=Arundo donax TaxID=35708 RepID=A0A0A9DUP1_ARUDO
MFMQFPFFCYLVRLFSVCLLCISSSAAIDLLKQLKAKDEISTYMVVDQICFWIDLLGIGISVASDFHSGSKIIQIFCLIHIPVLLWKFALLPLACCRVIA